MTTAKSRTTTLAWRDINIGDELTPLEIPVTATVIVAGLLIAPVLWLALIELIHWRRLVRRLHDARTMRPIQSHKKAIRNGDFGAARAKLHR